MVQERRGGGHAGDDDPNAEFDNTDWKSLAPGHKRSQQLLTIIFQYSQRCRLHPGR